MMKEVINFYLANSVSLQEITCIPKYLYKDILTRYENSNQSTSFEDFVKDNTWILVDESYRKIKDFDVFQNKNNLSSFFNKDEVDHLGRLKYFESLFNELFLKNNKLDTDNLNKWIKKYVTWGGKSTEAAYKAIVEILPTIDDENEVITMLKSLFLYSISIESYSYFDLLEKPVPTIDEVRAMLENYIDCSDNNPNLEEKYNYLIENNITADEIKEALKAILRKPGAPNEQKRLFNKIISMKSRKIKFEEVFDSLSKNNKIEFCSSWQQITGK